MRVLCFIMVGALFLSIAIAENDNIMRTNSQSIRSQLPLLPMSNADLNVLNYKPINIPWLSRRENSDNMIIHPVTHVMPEDNFASANEPVSQYIPQGTQNFKYVNPMTTAMILEPVHQPRQSSWTDWIPDFFDDDMSEGPGPLIGPMNFPGIGKHVYIRQNEPMDDDTEHIVIHLINREPIADSPPFIQQSIQEQKQMTRFIKNPVHQTDSSRSSSAKSSVTQYNLNREEDSSKISNDSIWSLQSNVADENTQDSQHSVYNHATDAPNENKHAKFTMLLLKHAGTEPPSVLWSRQLGRRSSHYDRSLNFQDTTAAPNIPQGIGLTHNNTVAKANYNENSNNILRNALLQSDSHTNSTKVSNESIRSGSYLQVPRTQPPLTHLKGNTTLTNININERLMNPVNKAAPRATISSDVYNSFSEGAPKTPRNAGYSTIKQFFKDSENKQQIGESSPIVGGLYIVPAPNMQQDKDTKGTNGGTRNNVIQNIMSLTATQTWKNVTTKSPNSVVTSKSKYYNYKLKNPLSSEYAGIEKRMDREIEENLEAKETNESRAFSVPVDATAETRIKEAVGKIMRSFTQWRHKVVSTNFLKKFDEWNGIKNKSRTMNASVTR